MKAELVFVPAPGIGHLVSTVEFAKRLLNRDQRLSVTVLVIRSTFAPIIDSYTHSLAAAGDSQIRYLELPQVEPPPLDLLSKSAEKFFSDFIENHKPQVRAAITDHVLSGDSAGGSSNRVRIAGLVVDLFCTSMIDVANELGVPSYVFFTSSAAFLGLMLHFPTLHNRIGAEFNESDTDIIIPSFANPVPIRVLPSFVFNKDGGYASFMKHGMKFSETRGIIVNTLAELEPHALNWLSDGHAPPVYTVGPVLDLEGQKHLPRTERDKIMNWLDSQPSSSVVLLCFGSMGTFGATQLAEMAAGLERSGHRFLWSIRRPPPAGQVKSPEDYVDYDEVLPAGFLKRVEGRGMVCGWVPQVEVLGHEAVGGFVSHCGWNSILESLWFGVPVVTWPMYAEQQINAFEMVRELGLAVELRLDYRKSGGAGCVDLVTAEEIERAVRCMMDGENPVRKRVEEMAEKSRKAVAVGGSSFTSIARLAEDMLGNNT